MKIAFIIDNLYGGGAERAEVNIMNALSERHEVTAIAYRNFDEGKNYPLSPTVRLLYRKPRFATESPLAYLNWAERFLWMKRIRRQEGFDAVVSFQDGGNAYNVLTACGEKTVVSIRNLISKSGKRRHVKELSPRHVPVQVLARRLQNRADSVVCVSEDVAQDQIENFRADAKKIVVIQNFVDAGAVRAPALIENRDQVFLHFVEKHGPVFCNSGRLAFQKGQWHLLKAFAELVADYPNAGLFLLGEGKLEPWLKHWIADLGLERNVLLCGYQTNPGQYVRYADWMVHSALYEGMSNAVLESLALGLPVICTDCAGTRELLTPNRPSGQPVESVLLGEYGILCRLDEDWEDLSSPEPTEGERALTAAMRLVIENPSLREQYQKASAERAEAFSKEVKTTEWEALLRSLVSGTI